MGQPQRMGDNRWEPLSEVCPECGSVNTLVMTMNSPDTVSCRCTVCAHVWRGGTSDPVTKTAMFPGQPSASSREVQQLLHECPKCASPNIGLGTVTSYSVYFRCRHCEEIWAFPDRRHVPRISGDAPARVKTDQSPRGATIPPRMADEPIALNCPRCGLPLQCIETLESLEHPTLYIYKCVSHGLFHFSERTDLAPGLPAPGLPPHRTA